MLRPHGLRGELRVQAFSPTARNLQRGRPVYVDTVRRVVERARQDQDAWIVKLHGLDSREQVEHLRGELLEAADTDVLRDDSDSYFVHELIGLMVVTKDGQELGRVAEVLDTGANDVYVVRESERELLVPAIGDVVDSIDVHGGRIIITPLAGMLDESK